MKKRTADDVSEATAEPVVPLALVPVKRASTAQQAADAIQQAILRGQLSLGSALSEHKLSASLNVSRTPLRAAFQMLAATGLVEITPYKGAQVFSLTGDEMRLLGQFRVVLEGSILFEAATQNHHRLIDALQAVNQDAQLCIDAGDVRAFGRLDTLFHQAIASNCNNKYFVQSLASVDLKVAVIRNLMHKDRAHIRRSHATHVAITKSLATNDIPRAVSLLEDHIGRGTDSFCRYLLQLSGDPGSA